MGHISDAISPTDFILGTKIQPNKAHLMIQVPMTLGQGQRSRSNFPKMGWMINNWPYVWCYFTHRLYHINYHRFFLTHLGVALLLGCTFVPSMKCVGEIAYKIWPVLWFFTHFEENLTLTFDLDLWPWPWVKVIGTWVIECALLGCTMVPSMKSVGEIASEIWPIL